MVGVQCERCIYYKKRLLSFLYKGWNKGKCIRISNDDKTKGVCWMEEEY